MIAVVSRVRCAKVEVDGKSVGSIGPGLLVLLGVADADEQSDLNYIVSKTAGLRIFTRDDKMNDDVTQVNGQILLVSQFTLLGDARKGRRPDFGAAAKAAKAKQLYERCALAFEQMGIVTQTGQFGADMHVSSVGDGPVTILLDSNKRF
ncbi:MAG: D-tyrosyl-tRNA(Tyr) deacylase [Clostridia bacterium]|jgi:D-aminoacyl-tRNA deacylase|nr:D-tyrosyl-tRNA(Tyr) deacylase [Clostridia bacterium]MBT7121812.1 D-tyrosyl-tRNA(Tyr) deacylase [Clostridia bacterium]